MLDKITGTPKIPISYGTKFTGNFPKMDEKSDAFIVLPGGVGTLEEAMEILSMRQLKLTHKPLVFINSHGFYNNLNEIFEVMIEQKFAKKNIRKMFAITPDPITALKYIFNYTT